MKSVGCLAIALCTILLSGVADPCFAADEAAIIEGKPLVIPFDIGKSAVSDVDLDRIGQYLGEYDLTTNDKILVVGHTDNSGDSKENFELSYQRAQTVRKEIISGLGMDGRHVIAIGRGDEIPVGDNKTQAGRARNRRVEIYLAQVVSGRLKGKNQRIDPDFAAIEALVQDAKTRLRRKDIAGALSALYTARDQGGDQVASWHAAYAITGFYAGVQKDAIKAHLQTALTMDPFNEDAREFMGRVKAQEDVAAGVVTMEMGQNEARPIAIRFDSQAREYLRLFGVQPLSRRSAKGRSIEVWRCSDSQGAVVDYYFDRTAIYGWAFSPGMQGAYRHQDRAEQPRPLKGSTRLPHMEPMAVAGAVPPPQRPIQEFQLVH